MKPEQTFFTLDEAAKHLACTAGEVLRYGAFHGLGMCAAVPGALVAEHIWRVAGGHSCAYQNSGIAAPVSGFFRIRADDLQLVLTRGGVVPKSIYPFDSTPGEVTDLSRFFMIEGWESEPVEIRNENLLIFANELNRFRDGLISGIEQPPTKPEPSGKRPGRPREASALANMRDALEQDAAQVAIAIRDAGMTATVDAVAARLAVSDQWCAYSLETIKPYLRASWWK